MDGFHRTKGFQNIYLGVNCQQHTSNLNRSPQRQHVMVICKYVQDQMANSPQWSFFFFFFGCVYACVGCNDLQNRYRN